MDDTTTTLEYVETAARCAVAHLERRRAVRDDDCLLYTAAVIALEALADSLMTVEQDEQDRVDGLRAMEEADQRMLDNWDPAWDDEIRRQIEDGT